MAGPRVGTLRVPGSRSLVSVRRHRSRRCSDSARPPPPPSSRTAIAARSSFTDAFGGRIRPGARLPGRACEARQAERVMRRSTSTGGLTLLAIERFYCPGPGGGRNDDARLVPLPSSCRFPRTRPDNILRVDSPRSRRPARQLAPASRFLLRRPTAPDDWTRARLAAAARRSRAPSARGFAPMRSSCGQSAAVRTGAHAALRAARSRRIDGDGAERTRLHSPALVAALEAAGPAAACAGPAHERKGRFKAFHRASQRRAPSRPQLTPRATRAAA